jgi:hypothetical protein
MSQGQGVVWSGRPWIGPALVLRTAAAVVVGVVIFTILSTVGILTTALFVPLYIWVIGLLALAWLTSLARLLVLRASYKYVLRQSSIEVDQGIVRKKSLVVSPGAFSELEVDQGIVGRILNYGSLEVRSQGGQQLNFVLIRDPMDVSAKIRDVMSIPTVKVAKEEPTAPLPAR